MPEKCGSAPEMDGVSELPDGFREATITCLEFINEVREAGRRREKKSTRHDWRVETLGSCIDRRSCIEPLCPSCGGEGRKKAQDTTGGVETLGSCIDSAFVYCTAPSVVWCPFCPFLVVVGSLLFVFLVD